MTVGQTPLTPDTIKVTRKVYMLPTILDNTGDFNIDQTIVSIGLFMIIPLLHVEEITSSIEARNHSLNVIGSASSVRQNFGTNSQEWTIRGYINDLEPDALVDYSAYSQLGDIGSFSDNREFPEGYLMFVINRIRMEMIKYSVYNQNPILIITNTGWDIITIDSVDIKELANEPFDYAVSIKATSARPIYQYGLKETSAQVGAQVGLVALENILTF